MASSGAGSEAGGAAVVVIGGGVTGLSSAWWLARTGIDVIVIEKGVVGWEASGRNGGGCTHHFSPFFPEEQRLWPQMDELLGYPTEFQAHRIRLIGDDRAMDFSRRAMANAERQGFKAEWLDAAQIAELVPLTDPQAFRGVYYHFGGHANPQRTVQAYAWAIQDKGGRIFQHTVATGFELRGGKVVAVETDRGRFRCDSLVIAAGPQTERIAAMLDVSVPMTAGRAEIMVTEAVPMMKIGGVDGAGLYGRQTLRGNLVYGGGPHEWLPALGMTETPRASTPLLQNIATRIARLFPKARHARALRSWSGIVENTPDGRPVIDRLRSPENVVIATMSSVGFGLSPASGRAIAELVQHGQCSFADLSTLRLSRFSNLAPDWRERQGWLPPDAEI
ncbi:MAG: FAD-binding oxidoreductase [Alphaproteobacteria bacterium]|nr:FAD-binding oxidoreductase [Alphaproteobacteria bacterium]